MANQVGLEHVNFMTKTWKAMSWSIDNKGLESQILNMLIYDQDLESQVLNLVFLVHVVWSKLWK